jgi:type II secretory pathway predicted ATPase ExeA
MYTERFGFRELPFNLTSDPRFFYANSAYQKAYHGLHRGIKLRKGLIVLTGESGTGKTNLIKMVQARCGVNVHTAVISSSGNDFAELLRLTMVAFGLKEIPWDGHALMQELKSYLIKQLEQDQILAMVIDEAQNLDFQTLNELASISELQAADQNLFQIVLVGRPELATKLQAPAFSSIRKRVALWCELGPLRIDEVGSYIDHRLARAGNHGKELFEPDAVRQIAVYSRGIPALINIICDNALFCAHTADQNIVTAQVICKVADNLRLHESSLLESGNDPQPAEKDLGVCDSGLSARTRRHEEQFCLEEWMIGLQSKPDREWRGPSPGLGISTLSAILVLAVSVVMLYTKQRQIPATKPYDPIATPEQASQQVGVDVPDEVADKKSVQDNTLIHPMTSAGLPKAQKIVQFEAVVYLHTSARNDRSVLEEISDALRVKGYSVADTRITGGRTQGDVRFFFLQDRRNAETVRSVVQSELGRRGYPIALKLLERDARKFEFAAPGKIEVWLPPLPNSRS